MRGSQHNDEFYKDKSGKVHTRTNFAGGTLGGISTGEDIYFRVAIKPVSTIAKKQKSVDLDNNEVELEATGRHDPCVLPRAIPIVDAMSALVIMDHVMRNKSQNG
jgi:chorismate synthase